MLNPATILRAAQIVAKHGKTAFKAGQAVGKAMKSQKKPQMSQKSKVSGVQGAVSSGTVSRGLSTPRFSVPFAAPILQVSVGSGGAVLQAIGTVPTGLGGAIVAVSPYQAASTMYYPACFPPTVQRLCQSFQRYRIRPGTAKLSYRTTVSTNLNGSIAIAVTPPEFPGAGAATYQSTATSECSIITPVWAEKEYFSSRALGSVLSDPEWKFTDFDNTVSQPEVRQDMMFNVQVATLGAPTSTVLGLLFFEGTLEFMHLQDVTTNVGLHVHEPEEEKGTGAAGDHAYVHLSDHHAPASQEPVRMFSPGPLRR
jgi:hypothetical protein